MPNRDIPDSNRCMKTLIQNKFVNLKSPIFWRITAGVFASILCIELLLLIYSWSTERERLITRLDESVTTLTSLLDLENPLPQLDHLLSSRNTTENFSVTGYIYESPTGIVANRGLTDKIILQLPANEPGQYDHSSSIYLSTTSREIPDQGSDKIRLQIDASWIKQYMTSYVKRIVGMVILISLFVTGACLLILTPLLINPLQRLNNVLISGEKRGIRSAKSILKDLNRSDELGSVHRSFDLLRYNLIHTENDKNNVTERFEDFANLGADCFWEIDNRFKFTYFSGDVKRVLSLSSDQIIGHSYRRVLSTLGDSVPYSTNIPGSLAQQGKWEGKIYPNSNSDSSPIYVRIVASTCLDAKGKFIGLRGTIADITKEKELAAELKYQATHDVLTGLHNRRELDTQLELSVDKYKSDGEEFSLLIMDLDKFKLVNDGGGHAAGDALLNIFAKIIKRQVGDKGTAARLGGDEFAAIIKSTDPNIVGQVAENIRLAIGAYTFHWNQVSYTVGISIGVASVSKTLDNPEAMALAADSCCMKAKHAGRNQVRVYSETDDDFHLFKEEAIWISRINKAIDDDTFVLFQQSIVRINNRDGENHFEILLRMKNPEGGIWTPNLFLPVAERNNLMPKIDQWVVTQSIKWLKTQSIEDNSNFCMNINLSAESLADPRFCEFLINHLTENQSLNKYVCLEMTETAAMVNFKEILSFLTQLKELGCLIALDDFGTGFSSLSHIHELPLDYIKIDGVFIQEIVNSELDQTLVRSVAEIAKVLQISTVAEFVDTEAALEMLDELNIDYAQGFLFSKPQELPFNDEPGEMAQAA